MAGIRVAVWILVVLCLLPVLGVGCGWAQASTAVVPASTVEDALHQMADAAGVIFVGQVVAVRRVGGEGGASGVVEVEFSIEQAVRGCSAGGRYVLREWAGLWAGGAQRYRVGQALLMMLHTPDAAGLSSPVSGLDGAIPVRGTGSGVEEAGNAGGGLAAPAVAVVDLRWVGTKLLRQVSSGAGGGVRAELRVGPGGGVRGEPGSPEAGVGSVAAQMASVEAVVKMLGVWGSGGRVAR